MRRVMTHVSAVFAVLAIGLTPVAAQEGPAPSPGQPLERTIAWDRDLVRGLGESQVAGISVAPNGRPVVVGSHTASDGTQSAAVWVPDGSGSDAWSRLDLEDAEGSIATATGTADGRVVVLGSTLDGADGRAWTSRNGRTWDAAPAPEGVMADAASTDAGMVAVGNSGTDAVVARSADGRAWESGVIAQDAQAHRVAVLEDGTIVVAGIVGKAGEESPTIWRSVDGDRWSQQRLVAREGAWSIDALVPTSAGLILSMSLDLGGQRAGLVLTSQDGSTWQARLVAPQGQLSAVTALDPDGLAFGDGRMWRSTDGVEWSLTPEDAFRHATIRDAAVLPDGRVLVAGEMRNRPGTPTVAVWSSYDAVFQGDATGQTDVTAALSEFLGSHDGQRVALKREGVYRVTQVAFTARDLTVDFRGARIKGTERGQHGIIRLVDTRRVVLNDPRVHGTGYEWDDDDQFEHGIHVDGGRDITLRRSVVRDTRGDGIYVGYRPDITRPPTGVRIVTPDIERASRNGIATVAGEVTIRGGRIERAGLHGVDFEPNDADGARSIRGIVEDVDIRQVGDLDTGDHTPYAVAVVSKIRTPRESLRVLGLTGDRLRMRIEDVRRVVIRRNESDRTANVSVRRAESTSFRGNTRLRLR